MENEQETPRKWGRCKKFFVFLLILAILGAVVYFYRDKPYKLVRTTDFNAEVNSAAGEIVDYHYAYNALQDEELGDPEENGWRLILQAFGPRALEQVQIASTIPWEQIPTAEEGKHWFEDYWTPLCEKFKLDPKERPTMYDRMDLWSYVEKHGLTGDEPEPKEDDWKLGWYYENYEKKPSKVENRNVYDALMRKPWTKEEYPYAAQWLDENADYLEVFSKAARSPRCRCWRILKDHPDGTFIGVLLPDAQYTREIARQLCARANYRLGSGDVSGALDDVETITLFARAKLESRSDFLVDRLVAVALLGIASGVQIYNTPVPPTDAELARAAALWRDFYKTDDLPNEYDYLTNMSTLALDSEKIFSLGAFQDLLVLRRNGSSVMELLGDVPSEFNWTFEWFTAKAMEWTFFTAPPVNDAKAFGKYREIWEQYISDPEFEDEMEDHFDVLAWAKSSPETNLAYWGAHYLLPAVAASREAFYRMGCVMREKSIVCALLAYQREHGALPPTFTVDAEGKPLHSWRVLILPYLGEKEKALYDEIALDEPWNSEHNRQFFDRAPSTYKCPSWKPRGSKKSRPDPPHYLKLSEDYSKNTCFSVLVGNDGFFDESGVGKDLNAALEAKGYDAARQPIVVERGEPVCWMKPDAELRVDHYATGLVDDVNRFFKDHRHAGGLNVASPSGSAIFIGATISSDELNALLRGLPEPPKKTDDVAELGAEAESVETEAEAAEAESEPTPEETASEPAEATETEEPTTEETASEPDEAAEAEAEQAPEESEAPESTPEESMDEGEAAPESAE